MLYIGLRLCWNSGFGLSYILENWKQTSETEHFTQDDVESKGCIRNQPCEFYIEQVFLYLSEFSKQWAVLARVSTEGTPLCLLEPRLWRLSKDVETFIKRNGWWWFWPDRIVPESVWNATWTCCKQQSWLENLETWKDKSILKTRQKYHLNIF